MNEVIDPKTRDLTLPQKIQVIAQVKEVGGPGSRTLQFIASTESIDRAEDTIDVAGWILDNYIGAIGKGSNPIFAWSHDYETLPVGKTIAISKDARLRALVATVYFPTIAELCSDPDHPSDAALFADTVYNMYKNGMLNAVSVGFKPKKWKTRDDDAVLEKPEWQRGVHYIEQELLEISAVLVPCNQEALISMRGIKSFNSKGIDFLEEVLKEKPIEENKDMDEAKYKALEDRMKLLEGQIADNQVKSGATFSAATKAKIKTIMDDHQTIIDAHKAMMKTHKAIIDSHEKCYKDLGDMMEESSDSGTMATDPGTDDGKEKPKPNADDGKTAAVDGAKDFDLNTASLADAEQLLAESKGGK